MSKIAKLLLLLLFFSHKIGNLEQFTEHFVVTGTVLKEKTNRNMEVLTDSRHTFLLFHRVFLLHSICFNKLTTILFIAPIKNKNFVY